MGRFRPIATLFRLAAVKRRAGSSASRLAAGFQLLTALALLAGCGPASDRLPITGSVISGALIQEGEYNILLEKGLRPGKYRVQITSPDLNAPPVMAPATPSTPSFPVQPERIPPEYNVKSSQMVEVTTDGDNRFVFDIVRQAVK
jgi:hypothetical protein